MSDLVRLSTSSAIIVDRIATILEQNNVPAMIKNNFESANLAGFGASQNDVDIFVNKSDMAKAQQLVEALGKED